MIFYSPSTYRDSMKLGSVPIVVTLTIGASLGNAASDGALTSTTTSTSETDTSWVSEALSKIPDVTKETVSASNSAAHVSTDTGKITFTDSPVVVQPEMKVFKAVQAIDQMPAWTNSSGSDSLLAQSLEDGIRLINTTNDRKTYTALKFKVSDEDGFIFRNHDDGAITMHESKWSLNGVLAAPWAIDATGKLLDTHFTTQGSTVSVKVDYSQATFPVVTASAIFPHDPNGNRAPYPFGSGDDSETHMTINKDGLYHHGNTISGHGCAITVDHPHNSSHVHGTVNVVGRVKCLHVTNHVTVSTQLWEKAWWTGFTKIGHPGEKTGTVTPGGHLESNAWEVCHNGATYRGTAVGHTIEEGNHYSEEKVGQEVGPHHCN